ncbi:MAG TPA: hypothetical protein PK794_08375, partial [Armatimonadota bacterium]|nr:hypothetical protein [Armatimonadota bacterium]
MSSSRCGKRRRWALLLLLLAVIGGGWWGYRVAHPVLTPVTRRLLPAGSGIIFSANGAGYPAVESVTDAAGKTVCALLDDRCRRVAGVPPMATLGLVSPTRRTIACGRYEGKDGYLVTPVWRDGKPDTGSAGVLLPLSGMITLTDAGAVCRVPRFLHTPNGRKIELPAGVWPGILGTNEPSLVTTFEPTATGPNVVIFDLSARKPKKVARLAVASRKRMLNDGMFYRQRERFLVVPGDDMPTAYQHERLIASYGAPDWQWAWGEDGTVWGMDPKGHCSLLRWRDTTPRLVKLPVSYTRGDTFVELSPRYYHNIAAFTPLKAAPAVWGDGRLIAVTETHDIISARTAALVERAVRVVARDATMPYRARVLTLYRDGKRIGTFQTRLHPLPKMASIRFSVTHATLVRTQSYAEHLAFTKDGKHLSWVIDAGKGVQ